MTKGAIASRQMAIERDKIKSNERINKANLEDKEKQRAFDRGENRKNRIANFASKLVPQFKIPMNNDPKFYKQYIPDLDRFTNLPVYQRLGAEKFNNYGLIARADLGSNVHNFTNPGVMVIDFFPTTGPQNGAISVAQSYPHNQALNRTKEQVLKSNSRSSVSWEGSDIGLNFFCTADIYTGLIEVKKALLIYQTYKGDNAYLAKTYLRALGWDYSDIDANIADYRRKLLVTASKFNSSVVAPADLTLYHRRAYLAGNVFADRHGTVKQVYMFKQRIYNALNQVGDGTQVFDRDTTINIQQMSVFFSWLDTMIERITANPDFVEMYMDLRSSIPNLLTFDGSIGENDTIEFNYDDLNRSQIHNIKMLPQLVQGNETVLKYDTLDWGLHINTDGYLYQGNSNGTTKRHFYWVSTSYSTDQVGAFRKFLDAMYDSTNYYYPKLLDMDKDDINGDDILEITRGLFTAYQGTSSRGVTLDIKSVGTEFFYGAQIWCFDLHTNTMSSHPISTYMVSFSNTPVIGDSYYVDVALYTKFDWAPMCTFVSLNDNVYTPVLLDNIVIRSASLFDLDHSFTINHNDLDDLNEACVLSELYLVTSQFKH